VTPNGGRRVNAVEAMARDAADLAARIRAHDAGRDVGPEMWRYLFDLVSYRRAERLTRL
jgi:hypothetical protein